MEKDSEMKQKSNSENFLSIPQEYIDATEKISYQVDNCCKKLEGRTYEEGDNVVICWKCGTLNLVHEKWEMIECNACHAYCKIPMRKEKEKIKNYNGYDLDKVIPGRMVRPRHTALVCPFCKYENKVNVKAKEFQCKACNQIWDILKPDLNPPQKYCDSVNPDSHYYKFKPEFRKDPQYPPPDSVGISDMFFPDPVLYHEGAPYPVNPFADYVFPYQEALSLKRAQKHMEFEAKAKNQLKKQYYVPENDKKKFYDITKNLISKIDNSIMKNNYMSYVSEDIENDLKKSATPNRFNNSNFNVNNLNKKLNASTDKFIQTRNNEKSKLIEDLFLMKK